MKYLQILMCISLGGQSWQKIEGQKCIMSSRRWKKGHLQKTLRIGTQKGVRILKEKKRSGKITEHREGKALKAHLSPETRNFRGRPSAETWSSSRHHMCLPNNLAVCIYHTIWNPGSQDQHIRYHSILTQAASSFSNNYSLV